MFDDLLTFPPTLSVPDPAPRSSQPASSETSFAALYSEAIQATQIASTEGPGSTGSSDDWMSLLQFSPATSALNISSPVAPQLSALSALRGELMQHVQTVRSAPGQSSTSAYIDSKTPIAPAAPEPASSPSSAPPQAENKVSSRVHRLISWIDTHAHLRSTHHCAASVRQAMEAAGMQTADRPPSGDAGDYGPFLLRHGAEIVPQSSYQPLAGDIAVFERSEAHPAGHIQVFDGQHWVSDFTQNTFSPYRDQTSTPSVTVYRLS